MKVLSRCDACKQLRLYVRRRTYKTVKMGNITSRSYLCRKCARAVTNILKTQT